MSIKMMKVWYFCFLYLISGFVSAGTVDNLLSKHKQTGAVYSMAFEFQKPVISLCGLSLMAITPQVTLGQSKAISMLIKLV